MFTVFDRDALIGAIKTNVTRIGSDPDNSKTDTSYQPMRIDEWDEIMSGEITGMSAGQRTANITQDNVEPLYADELPPLTSGGVA